MKQKRIHQLLTCLIATIWLINGLVCKVLNLVPRHREIVERILGGEYARLLTIFIGVLEIGMAIWIVSGIWKRLNSVIQIVVIAIMNTFEYFLVPDLLLWGRANLFFAFLLILAIYYNEFHMNPKLAFQS